MTETKTTTSSSGEGVAERRGDHLSDYQEPRREASPSPAAPDPQVMAKARRRRFSPTEIAKILADLDRLPAGHDRGAYLRNAGLYSSQVATWRRRQSQGQAVRRGPKPREANPLEKVVAEKDRRIRQLERKLKRAELMLEIQKKAQEALDTFQEKDEDSGESA